MIHRRRLADPWWFTIVAEPAGRRSEPSTRSAVQALSGVQLLASQLLLDAAGRRRSPATMPGFRAGRPPRNKGVGYPADPPKVEEIVAVMRAAGDSIHGCRLRGLIVVLWRAGLRISEALAAAARCLASTLARCRVAPMPARAAGPSSAAPGPRTPLLLVDVDGVLSLYGSEDADLVWTLVDGIPHRLSPRAAETLAALAPDFECVWCTGWKDPCGRASPAPARSPARLAARPLPEGRRQALEADRD